MPRPAVLLAFLALPIMSCSESDAPIAEADLDRWLGAYGDAWETRSAERVVELFTDDAVYRETPYAEPFEGSAAIAEYWMSVTADQEEIAFSFEPLAVDGRTGVAAWTANFRSVSGDMPVELNGVFVLEFADPMTVGSLREWWHVR